VESFTEAVVRRQRLTQLTLVLIILATIPCYCVGAALYVYKPVRRTPTAQPSLTATRDTGQGITPTVTVTTAIPTTQSPLYPTPTQFVLPQQTFVLYTIAPTRTNSPFPTAQPYQSPSNTPIVIQPTVIVVPTSTPTNRPPTATNQPPTVTNTNRPPTATNTQLPPTVTNTQIPPTATNTQLPPTATNTQLPQPTATNTQLPQPTATHTPATATPTP
jgi:hypothetical protein